MESILIRRNGMALRVVYLDEPAVMIGRDPHLEVCLNDVEVSRRHAVLFRDRNGCLSVRDLGSRNGTFVNGARLDEGEEVTLLGGDFVRIGRATLRYYPRGVPPHLLPSDSGPLGLDEQGIPQVLEVTAEFLESDDESEEEELAEVDLDEELDDEEYDEDRDEDPEEDDALGEVDLDVDLDEDLEDHLADALELDTDVDESGLRRAIEV